MNWEAVQAISEAPGVLKAIVQRRIGISGFSAWWERNTDDYDNEFVHWIEQIRDSETSPNQTGSDA